MSAPLKIEDIKFVDFNTPEMKAKYQKEVVEPSKAMMEKTKINWKRMNVKYYATLT